jgi:NTE family protein
MYSISANSQTQETRPKIGLALSGGGAKGFAHIGVIKVLEEIGIPIDCISGTSMGSIVGGLYAIGCSSKQLEDLATQTNWDEVLQDEIDRNVLSMEQKPFDDRYVISLDLVGTRVKLPSGIIAGQKVLQMLNQLTQPVQHVHSFLDYPVPFVCVATDIVTGEAVVLKEGALSEALRASMAIPSIFTPIQIDGRILVDGMVARNFPVQEAREVLGADIVIGVDVGQELLDEKQLDSFLSIMNQTLTFQMADETARQRQMCDYLITPKLAPFGAGDFEQAAYFIQQGELAARAIEPQLRQLKATIEGKAAPPSNSDPTIHHFFSAAESLYVSSLEIQGLNRLPANFVVERLNLKIPGKTTLTNVAKAINRVYGSQFFERVGYEFRPMPTGKKLVLHIKERSKNLFRTGLRYDSKNETAIIFNTIFRNTGRIGTYLSVDLKLGNNILFDTQYFSRTGFRRLIGIRWRGTHFQKNIDEFSGTNRISRRKLRTTFGDIFLGSIFSNYFTLGVGNKLEYNSIEPIIAPVNTPIEKDWLYIYYGELIFDTLDKTTYPTNGVRLQLVAEKSTNRIISKNSFYRLYLDTKFVKTIIPNVTLLSQLFLGSASEDVPRNYHFALGGNYTPFVNGGTINSFYGFHPYELQNRHAQYLMLGTQCQVWDKKYLIISGNMGNTFDKMTFRTSINDYFYGVAVTLGVETFMGPVEIIFSGSKQHNILTYFRAGYNF